MLLKKRKFHLTYHAKKNMKIRDMPNPNVLWLSPCNRKTKKLIKESCPNEGFNVNLVYWSTLIDMVRYVYVCSVKDICEYTVITCFKYEELKKIIKNDK
jgi:hypothetical protein